MKLVLYVLGEKGVFSLKAMPQEAKSSVLGVVIGRDSNVKNDFSTELESICDENSWDRSYDDTEFSEATLLVAIGWRKLIDVGEGQKLIVLHDSILPRYRGFNPLVTALINGDKEIGVTALFGDKTYDTGPIIDAEIININYPIKIQKAIEIIGDSYGVLLNRILQRLMIGDLQAIPQKDEDVTYSLWRDKEDYFIDWNSSAEQIARKVDAVGFPYDGAKFRWKDEVFTIHDVRVVEDIVIENRTPGKLIFKKDGKPVIVCGKGLLCLENVTKEDGKKESFESKFRIKLS